MSGLFERQKSGSVVCPACGKLVGVNDERCFHCGRRNPGMWGYGKQLRRLAGGLGVSEVVIFGCGALYLLGLVLDLGGIRMQGSLSFLAPSSRSLDLLGWSGAVPVLRDGRWYTLLSAGWLHGGLIHILFNMMWVRQLAPAATAVYGPGRTMILYVVSSVAGFALSVAGFLAALQVPLVGMLMGRAAYTVGASAAVFGLLGAIVYAGRRGVAAQLSRQAWSYALILFVFGLIFPGVDNWAHLGGFVGGYFLAAWFNPLKPEKPDHLLGGLAAIALSALAIVLSVLRGFGG